MREQTLLLLIALLLALWLLTRTQRHQRALHRRRMPTSADELGRVLFAIAKTSDLDAFRHLYLSGAEARDLLGQAAVAYLQAREQSWLDEELLEISVRVGPLVRYEGARIAPDGTTLLQVSSDATGAYEVPVGRAVQVGRIWRLREPVGDWTPHRWTGAKRV